MDPLQLIAGIIGFSANIPLFIGICRNKIDQSFATFMLWALLDAIATITTILQHGNYLLPLGYSFTAAAITIALIVKKKITWSWVESLTALLVLVCLVLWYTIGDKAGTVASSLAVVIATIPQAVDTYKKPEKTPAGIYFIYFLAATLSFIAGKTWTVEERFYSGSVIFLTAVIILFSMRKVIKPVQ